MPINSSDAIIARTQALADAIGALAEGLPDAQAIPLLSVQAAIGTPGSTIVLPGVGEKSTGLAWTEHGVKTAEAQALGAVLDVMIAKVNELVGACNALGADPQVDEIEQADLEGGPT